MALALTLAMLLPGCKSPAPPELDEEEIQEQREQILSDPETMGQVIARIGSETLTNGQLQPYFWAAVGEYQMTQPEIAPDYSQDLGEQLCPLDPEGGSWRDYFLNQALQMWHTCQALALQGEQEGVPTEEAYQPDPEKHEKYMTGMPATRYLYGYSQSYQPNTMHQAFLDNVDALLEDLAQKTGCADPEELASLGFGTTLENLRDFVTLYNWGYMYYTTLSYDLEPTQEQVESCLQQEGQLWPEPEGEMCCDVRHILLLPESDTEEGWEACMQQAQDLLKTWQKSFRVTEDTFASLANQYSQDTGTAVDGGGYYRLRQGQLLTQMDAWCFDPERQPGDTALFRTSKGVHILYFSGAESARTLWAEDRCREQMMKNLIASAREAYPMEVEREEIVLVPAQPLAGAADLLYPDVGHERFPEVPLYLQQDYGYTKFGNYNLSTNGCGITSFAMVSSYLSDEEWTPPELCARYGNYSYAHGTDGMIFDLGEVHVQAVAFPGHTAGSTAFLVEEDRLLITGDCCNNFTFLFGPEAAPVEAYRETVVQVRDRLTGRYDRIFVSHHGPELPVTLLDEMIELCDQVLAGDTDDVPFSFMGMKATIAKKMDTTFRRSDGKAANLVYSKSKIHKALACTL